jgi:NitT/TauT family transport system permease protein
MKDWQLRLLSLLAALGAWYFISWYVPGGFFPGPVDATSALIGNIRDGQVFTHLSMTLLRVFGGLALAMLIGIPVGVIMGMSAKAEKLLDLWLMIALAIPSLCYGLICFIVLGLNEVGATLAIALTGAPSIAVNVLEGVKNLDPRLLRMAEAFRADRTLLLRHVVMPQLAPYIMASLRFGLGLIWKIAVIVELLGLPNGVGFQLYYWYQLADMRQVLAWTLVFTLTMMFIEMVIFKQIERKLFAWRPGVAR